MFLILSADELKDIPLKEGAPSLGELAKAQAMGDLVTLSARGRRVMHLHLPDNSGVTLGALAKVIQQNVVKHATDAATGVAVGAATDTAHDAASGVVPVSAPAHNAESAVVADMVRDNVCDVTCSADVSSPAPVPVQAVVSEPAPVLAQEATTNVPAAIPVSASALEHEAKN